MNIDFDAIYTKYHKPYGDKPSEWVVKILKYQRAPALVLDLGICYGRNALFLAKQGFFVEGVDVSQVAISECLKEAERSKLKIKCFHQDIKDFEFKKEYDVIFSTATLQYLGSEDNVTKIIDKMKAHTKIGGLNIISAPTDTKIGMRFPFYFKKGNLEKYYKDWEILESDEEEDKFSNGRTGTIAFIIARKNH